MSGALNFTLADVTKFVLHTYIHYRECQLDNTDYWITVFSKVISFMLEKRGSANSVGFSQVGDPERKSEFTEPLFCHP